MKIDFVTEKSGETKKMGKLLAQELRGGEIICLSGELGAGKTTFTQGLLEGLGAQRPYTSPTFVVMKEYKIATGEQEPESGREVARSGKINTIYHFDAYRVEADDILNLGWEEIIANSRSISIIEWADKLGNIIPARAVWIDFEWISEKQRKLTIRNAKTKNLLKSQKRAKNT